MLKVVYFDENSAIDYLNICNGGSENQTTEDSKTNSKGYNGGFSGKLLAKLNQIPVLGVNAELGGSARISSSTEKLIKKTVSNTILTDFLELSDKKGMIELSEFKVYIYEMSAAYLKTVTPFMSLLSSEMEIPTGHTIDPSRLDEVLRNAKGYYELIAEKIDGTEKCIFRFNLEAFRNNYGLADMEKMNLVFWGVLVGESDEETLNFRTNFLTKDEKKPVFTSREEIEEANAKNNLKVYDIYLAGVKL